jgi:uncharacterized membrane protein
MTLDNSANTAADGISMVAIAKRIALVVVFLWFFLGCVPHFKATAMEMSIMPPYIPYPREMVLISGAFELLGAIGILIPRTRRAAGVGLLLLTIAVTPANVFMLQHADVAADFPPAVPGVPALAHLVEHLEYPAEGGQNLVG